MKTKMAIAFLALAVPACWGQYYNPYGSPPPQKIIIEPAPEQPLDTLIRMQREQNERMREDRYRQQQLDIERERNRILEENLRRQRYGY